jgi:hypothetical protein
LPALICPNRFQTRFSQKYSMLFTGEPPPVGAHAWIVVSSGAAEPWHQLDREVVWNGVRLIAVD